MAKRTPSGKLKSSTSDSYREHQERLGSLPDLSGYLRKRQHHAHYCYKCARGKRANYKRCTDMKCRREGHEPCEKHKEESK